MASDRHLLIADRHLLHLQQPSRDLSVFAQVLTKRIPQKKGYRHQEDLEPVPVFQNGGNILLAVQMVLQSASASDAFMSSNQQFPETWTLLMASKRPARGILIVADPAQSAFHKFNEAVGCRRFVRELL